MKNMTTYGLFRTLATVAWLGCSGAALGGPFSSGSTGADGTFAPTQNTAVALPANGIFNFTTVNIPAGVTVTFQNNGTNTPVTILATGDVTIAGTIDIRGAAADAMKSTPGSFLQQGGLGGPGGYSGGRGGDSGGNPGASGQGPGGGEGGAGQCPASSYYPPGGGGGGFAGGGSASFCKTNYPSYPLKGAGGAAYGSSVMLPLVGGSGGGGGRGSQYNTGVTGGGGGGGGGALLIAASGTVKLSGSILAQGGAGSAPAGCSWSDSWGGGGGGGGSGGIVRILAQAYQNAGGTINVAGGGGGCSGYAWWGGGNGSNGYLSVETLRGGTLSLSDLPSLQIASVGGQSVPANPTGIGDVTLPATQTNPVPIQLTARFVPPGTAVKLMLTPAYSGDVVTVNASNLAGTRETSTASANINIPYGASTLIAQVSFSLTVAMGDALSVYAEGERVDSVRLTAAFGGPTQFKLVTVSGREFDAPPAVMAMIPPN